MGIERDRFARGRGEYQVHGRGSMTHISTTVSIDPTHPQDYFQHVNPAVQPKTVPPQTRVEVTTPQPVQQVAVRTTSSPKVVPQTQPPKPNVVATPIPVSVPVRRMVNHTQRQALVPAPVAAPKLEVAPSQEQPYMSDDYNAFASFLASDDSQSDTIELKTPKKARKARQGQKSHRVLKAFAKTMAVLVLFGLSIGAGAYTSKPKDNAKLSADTSNNQVASVSSSTSSGDSSVVLGASTDSANDSSQTTTDSPYYQISDTFMGGSLTLSRQPLPEQYKTDEQAFVNYATQINATKPISTSKWGMAYMYDGSAASKVQVLIFKDSSRLLTIQSQQHHSAEEWVNYIDSIKQ